MVFLLLRKNTLDFQTKAPTNCPVWQKCREPGAHSKRLVPPVGTRGTIDKTCAPWVECRVVSCVLPKQCVAECSKTKDIHQVPCVWHMQDRIRGTFEPTCGAPLKHLH
jgi:hypothetical protein